MKKILSGGGVLNKVKEYLSKDIKEYNKVFLGLVCLIILMTAVFTSLKISNSYAIFTDSIKGKETITLTLDKNLDKSGANKPVLSDAMVPVYYSDTDKQWHKADENNEEKDYKWYDYDKKMWANTVTYDHTKLSNESKTKIEGKTFNGTSDYVDMGHENEDFGNTITLVARFSSNGYTSNGGPLIDNSANPQGFEFFTGNTNNSACFQFFPGNEIKQVCSDSIPLKEWHTAVVTYNGQVIKMYLDGTKVKEQAATGNINVSNYSVKIGTTGVPGNYFNGTISDVLLIKEVLDEQTIKKNYANEINHTYNKNQLFYSKFDNKMGTVKEAKYTEEGMTFDGTNDYVDVGLANYDFKNTITLAARFSSNGYTSNGGPLIDNSANPQGFEFFTGNTNNSACFQFFPGNEIKQVCSDSIPLKEWHTAVVTYNGKVIKMYLDGKEEKTLEATENINVSNYSVKIGTTGVPGNYFKGTISDALVMDKILSDSEAEGLSKDNNFKDYAKDNNTLIYNNLRGYESKENGAEVPMDIISTMQVWIPRYKYKVWNYNEDGNTPSDPRQIEITFENGENTTGEITCKDNIQGEGGDGTSETCRINNQTCTDALCNEKTYTHPGFTFGDKELTGFWVGKFELSSDIVCTPDNYDVLGNNCNLDTIRPLIKPNLYSWRGASTSTFETVAFAMKEVNNKYGFSTNDDIHIIKNNEWGAVAYLSHSKYGKNGEVYNNAYNGSATSSSDPKKYMIGCGPQSKESSETTTTCNSYNTELGKEASTTGNIYGVYDMAGGTWEYTMTILSSKNKGEMITGNSGYSGLLYNNGSFESVSGKDLPDAKYYDKYSYNEADNIKNLKIHKLGDGTREIYQRTDSSTTNGNVNYGWYDDYNHSLNAYSVWANRGGYSINTNKAGIFASYQSSSGSSLLGCASIAGSSRLIILSK